jgi:hypothetical protein
LPHRFARTAGEGWGCLLTGMHLALKGWLGRKWLVPVLVGLQALRCEHLALRLASPGCWARPARHMGTPYARASLPVCWVNANPSKTQGSWVQRQDPVLLGPRQDPRLMGPASRPVLLGPVSGLSTLGSCNRTSALWSGVGIQGWCVLHQDPRLLGLGFLNIIIFLINIIIFIIVESINIKHIIISILNIISSIIIKIIIFIPQIRVFFILILWIIIKIIIFRTQIILFWILILSIIIKIKNICTANNNIYTTNNIIFNINTFNDNKNNNLPNTNNNIFYINTLNYNKNINIYNTNNTILIFNFILQINYMVFLWW